MCMLYNNKTYNYTCEDTDKVASVELHKLLSDSCLLKLVTEVPTASDCDPVEYVVSVSSNVGRGEVIVVLVVIVVIVGIDCSDCGTVAEGVQSMLFSLHKVLFGINVSEQTM